MELFIPLLICVIVLVLLALVAALAVFYTRERSRVASLTSSMQSLPVGPLDTCNYGSMGEMYSSDKNGGFGEIFIKEEKTEEEVEAEKKEESQKTAMNFLEKYNKSKSTEGLNIIKETKINVEEEERIEVKSSSRENIGEDKEDNKKIKKFNWEDDEKDDLIPVPLNEKGVDIEGLESEGADNREENVEPSDATVFLDTENEKPIQKTGKRVRARSFIRSVFGKKK